MKIIQILNTPNWSGVANYCVSVSLELAKRGHEVLILTEPGKAYDRALEAGLRVDDSIRLNHRNPYLYAHAIKRMRHIFKTFNPDIISSHINEGAWMAGLIARKTVPDALVARVRTDIDPPKGHFINRHVHHAWTDHIIVGSQLHKDLCHEILNYDPDKITIVYGGVDIKKFNPTHSINNSFRKEIGATDSDVVIGMIARLDPIKGHEYALEALSKLLTLPVNFKFAALGYENQRTFAWLKKLAEKLSLGDRLHCFDLRKDIEIVAAGMDIGFITSNGSEANSRACLEFMASGKPVVSTAVGVIPEIMTDKEQGFLVQPQATDDMAAALKKLIMNKNLRESMGRTNRQHIENNFSLESFATTMELAYENIYNKQHRHNY